MLEEIQQWFREAVELHGDDWPSIERYVAAKVSGFSPADRARLLEEFRAIQPLELGLPN